MARQKEGIDVFRRIFHTVLVERTGSARQAHCGKAVVLCNNKVSGVQKIDKRKIHAVGPLRADNRLDALSFNAVGGIAQNNTFFFLPVGKPNRLVHDGTTVRINKNAHYLLRFFRFVSGFCIRTAVFSENPQIHG